MRNSVTVSLQRKYNFNYSQFFCPWNGSCLKIMISGEIIFNLLQWVTIISSNR